MLILGIIMNGVSEGSGRQIWSYQGRVRDYVRTTNWKIAFDVCDLRSAAARNHLQQSRLETRAWRTLPLFVTPAMQNKLLPSFFLNLYSPINFFPPPFAR